MDSPALEDVRQMLMTGEKQYLVSVIGEVAEHVGGGLGSLFVEVDEHVVEHNRQVDPLPGELFDNRQSHREE